VLIYVGGGNGPIAAKKIALIFAPEYAKGGAFPPLDFSPASMPIYICNLAPFPLLIYAGGGNGPMAAKKMALIFAPEYPEGGAFPPLDFSPAANQLKLILGSKFGISKVTLLSAAVAADAVEAVQAVSCIIHIQIYK